MTSLLLWPSPPQLPKLNDALAKLRTDRPTVAVAIISSVGLMVVGQVIRRALQVRAKRGDVKRLHVEKLRCFVANQEAQAQLRREECPDGEFEYDVNGADALWVKGMELGCCEEDLQGVVEILSRTLKDGVGQCLQNLDHWMYKRRLLDILNRVEAIGCQQQLGDLWSTAKAFRQKLWLENYYLLFAVMSRTGWSRLCRLVITVSVAYVADEVASASAESFDHWTSVILEGGTHCQMLKWATHYLLASLLDSTVEAFGARLVNYLAAPFKRDIDTGLYNSLITQDTCFFDLHTAEEVAHLSAITEDLHDADEKLHSTVDRVVRALCRTRHLWRTSPTCFMAATVLYACHETISQKCTQIVELFNLEELIDKEEQTTLAGLCHNVDFIMDNIKILRVNGRDRELVRALVERRLVEDADETQQYGVQQRIVETSTVWLLAAIRCAGLWYGVHAILQGHRDEVQMDSFLSQTFLLCVDWVQMDFSWLPLYAANTASLMRIIDTVPNIERDGGLVPEAFAGKIEFRDVHFSYPMRPDIKVLHSLSFTIEAGQKVAFVGQSGSGKSTVMCLLQRLYEPDQGAILLDDMPIQLYDVRWLRRQIGLVLQDTLLFDMTVEENIKLGNPVATQEDVIAAAKEASAFEFIMALPAGLQTRLGRGNVSLSGGQKQRLNIAQALVKQPRLMLLDEFTSALDNCAEAEVVSALAAREQCTVISIAHRLGALSHVDQVMVFSKGTVIEHGTIEELQAKGGAFCRLYEPHLSTTPRRASWAATGLEGLAKKLEGRMARGPAEEPTVAVDVATVRKIMEEYEELVRWVQKVSKHPEVQHCPELRQEANGTYFNFSRKLAQQRDLLPAVHMDFNRKYGSTSPWSSGSDLGQSLAKAQSMRLMRQSTDTEKSSPTSAPSGDFAGPKRRVSTSLPPSAFQGFELLVAPPSPKVHAPPKHSPPPKHSEKRLQSVWPKPGS